MGAAMSTNSEELYEQACLALAATLVIKSEESAVGRNNWVRDYLSYDASEDDPETWLYYMELAGEYHFTHAPMYVVSTDNRETILFSKENLELHRGTKKEYAYGTRSYKELLIQYPDQEGLILGILNPVDKNLAIHAPNWTIIGWDPGYVEANEYTLIRDLQTFVDGYRSRWVNPKYNRTDDLCPAWDVGRLALLLIPAITVLRKARCKTNEAHPYHVGQYLMSNGYLDEYTDYTSHEQAMWLYRNILHLKNNPGTQDNFEWLYENLLTPRHIPLGEFTMRHNLSTQPEDDYPTLSFRRTPLNLGYNIDPVDTYTLERLMAKEIPLAQDNGLEYADAVVSTREALENSLSNVVQTKALESSMFDLTGATPWSLEDILLNEWLHLSTAGIYKATIVITDPRTSERIPLDVKDAFTLMLYCQFGSIGLPLEYIEPVAAQRVQRVPAQTLKGLRDITLTKYISDDELKFLLGTNPLLTQSDKIISIDAFLDLGMDIFQAAQTQRAILGTCEHHFKRGLMHGAVTSLYADVACNLVPERMLYSKWLADNNLKFEDFSQSELSLLELDIIRQATGLSLSTAKSIKDVQKALVRLLGQLSSYSVQFLTSINEESIKVFDWPMIRIGDTFITAKGRATFVDTAVRVKTARGRQKVIQRHPVTGCGVDQTIRASIREQIRLDIPVKPGLPQRGAPMRWIVRMESAPVYIRSTTPEPVALDSVNKNPISDFSYLSAGELATMRDIYNSTSES